MALSLFARIGKAFELAAKTLIASLRDAIIGMAMFEAAKARMAAPCAAMNGMLLYVAW